ncbi:hypothetical protein [Pontixanthobacter sp.]|uniref:hypothetical protein n=1 Tax=Pontixanthobacter sp. TaxID=2792078 RepID=UPI003C7DFD7F
MLSFGITVLFAIASIAAAAVLADGFIRGKARYTQLQRVIGSAGALTSAAVEVSGNVAGNVTGNVAGRASDRQLGQTRPHPETPRPATARPAPVANIAVIPARFPALTQPFCAAA